MKEKKPGKSDTDRKGSYREKAADREERKDPKAGFWI